MIIQNLKTGRDYEVTKEEYAKLKEKMLHLRFKVISTDDANKKPLIPKEILEYIKEPKKLKINKQEDNG